MDSSVDQSSYVRGVLQKITPIVKDNVKYSRANEQNPGGQSRWGRTRMTLV